MAYLLSALLLPEGVPYADVKVALQWPGLFLAPMLEREDADVEQLRMLSATGEAAYIGAEYSAGEGTQWGVLYRNGEAVYGPAQGPHVINEILRAMGVIAKAPDDEFDTVGLGRHRFTERWLLP